MNKLEQEILNKLDHVLLVARESVSPSLSDVILTMTKKLDEHIKTHEEDVKDIKNDIAILKVSVEPAVSAIDTANSMKRGVTWLAGFIIAFGVIFGAVKILKDWIKN